MLGLYKIIRNNNVGVYVWLIRHGNFFTSNGLFTANSSRNFTLPYQNKQCELATIFSLFSSQNLLSTTTSHSDSLPPRLSITFDFFSPFWLRAVLVIDDCLKCLPSPLHHESCNFVTLMHSGGPLQGVAPWTGYFISFSICRKCSRKTIFLTRSLGVRWAITAHFYPQSMGTLSSNAFQ